jgi:hypothetical protein
VSVYLFNFSRASTGYLARADSLYGELFRWRVPSLEKYLWEKAFAILTYIVDHVA